ncbi:MAG TPA: hypothetical protein VGH89_16685 [Pseudonocardia sp.]
MELGVATAGFAAGMVIAVLTTPAGVSGAVFLLPVQLDLLRVPCPAVTPTNLLFNVMPRHQRSRSIVRVSWRPPGPETLESGIRGSSAKPGQQPRLCR